MALEHRIPHLECFRCGEAKMTATLKANPQLSRDIRMGAWLSCGHCGLDRFSQALSPSAREIPFPVTSADDGEDLSESTGTPNAPPAEGS